MSDPSASIKTVLTSTTYLQTPEDAELGARVREIVHKALDEVEFIMAFGAHEDRMAIVRALLSPAGRLIGVGAGSQKEEQRVALDELFDAVRAVPTIRDKPLVTDEGIFDVESKALPQTVDDQDEVDGDEET